MIQSSGLIVQPVMGKAYIDHPFAATIASTVAHFPEQRRPFEL